MGRWNSSLVKSCSSLHTIDDKLADALKENGSCMISGGSQMLTHVNPFGVNPLVTKLGNVADLFVSNFN